MTFNSITFVFFFLIVLALYHGMRRHHRAQNVILLIASYVFYGAWDWRFLSLMGLSTVLDYSIALAMAANPRHSRRLLTASVVINLGILFFFKYFGFFQASAVEFAARLGIELHPFMIEIVLPVGISFYTFQTLSYTIDVARGRLEARRNLLDFALFVAFFPQLVAGPIERASHFLPQVERERHLDWDQVREGIWLIATGYLKKVFIADNLASFVDQAFAPDFSGGGADYLVATWAFAIQIYGDFSGYSDVARGTAKLLGFDLMVNFNVPYLARNPSDFWRRWHISLSTWLRDYLYISLGGNRISTARTYLNLFLTMLLGGLWHGAAWTFVIWGAFHGTWLAVHRALQDRLPRLPGRLSIVGLGFCAFLTFQGVCLGWIFFRAASVDQAIRMISVMASGLEHSDWTFGAAKALVGYTLPLVLIETIQLARGDSWILRATPAWAQGVAYALIFYLVTLHGAVSDAFIYFQF